MVRDALSIARSPLTFLERVVARHGDLVAFPSPRGAVLLVNDPAGVRRVLQDNPRGYGKDTVQYRSLAAVTGQGLLTADGDTWREHRRLVQPAFHHGALAGLAEAAVGAGLRLRERWDAAHPAPVDADAALMAEMLTLVGRTFFAADLDPAAGGIVTAVDGALRLLVRRARSPVPRRWPTPSRHRLRRAVRTVDGAVEALLAGRRALPPGRAPDDVLGLLLAAHAQGALTDRGVRDEIVTLVIAGYETVASSLTWTLGLLADHPGAQDALAAEVDALGGVPSWTDLPRLPYTRAVLDEALRLYPPAWALTRRALAEDRVAGVSIPAGTLVIISPWLLHRREADWPEPDRFDPGRFLGRSPGTAAPRGGYLPFGLGPRLCIGRDVALTEAVLVLATLLRGRRVHRPDGARAPAVDALVTLRPRGGLPLVLTRS